jgi:exopolyphosphatase/guanosine-5'-triphosphate,3'-diphosphate pyrophosphatase
MGCATLIEPDAARALVFDIGGGSTEVALVARTGRAPPTAHTPGLETLGWVSVPWGVVSLAESEPHDAGSPEARLEAYGRMRARVASHLTGLAPRLTPDVQFLGASGTVTTLAGLQMGLATYDRRRVDGAWTAAPDMRALSRQLAAMSPRERAAIPGIGPDRADLVVAGAAILEAVLDTCPAVERLRVADRGLREGILRSMMARDA